MTEKCVICEGDFYTEALDKNRKCAVCAKEYPNAKNHDEALRQTVSKKDQMTTLTELRVREIVGEEIQRLAVCKAMESPAEKPKKPEKTDEEKQADKDRMAKARAARKSNKETKKETDK